MAEKPIIPDFPSLPDFGQMITQACEVVASVRGIPYDFNGTLSLENKFVVLFKTVKEMFDAQDELVKSYKALYDFVNQYFTNLDVQDEVNKKIQSMVNDGSLLSLIQPTISNTTSTWLHTNITNPTSPPLDKSFTIENAAAESKAVGTNAFLVRGEAKTPLINNTEMGVYYITTQPTDAPENIDVRNNTLFVFNNAALGGRYQFQLIVNNDNDTYEPNYCRIVNIDSNSVFKDWYPTIYTNVFKNNGSANTKLSNYTDMGVYWITNNATDAPLGINTTNMTLLVYRNVSKDGSFVRQTLLQNEEYAGFPTYTRLLTIDGDVQINWYATRSVIATDGKTYAAVGDSITEQGKYLDKLNKLLLNIDNYGVSSCTIAINNTYLKNKSIVERFCGLNGNTAIAMHDYYTIWGGLNDVLYKSKLGSFDVRDNTTIYGALRTICEHVCDLGNPERCFLVTTPHSNRDGYSKEEYGITIEEIRKAIFDVGEYYGIKVIDLYSTSGINAYNLDMKTLDGVHINDNGSACVSYEIYKAFINCNNY